jgi:glucose-1-phosphate thymidylyltransferase
VKGIILAGGAGSRLFPLTLVASKQLQPVYDKPMVYYPLTTLIEGGVREFCLISTTQDLPRFRQLLGDGRAWGLSIEYREQARPEGIAQAFLIAESFIGGDPVTLILGDNIFYGGDGFQQAFEEFETGATIFGYHVTDPERYGVVEFDARGQAVSIAEKPAQPRSNYAIPGLYLYDNQVVSITRGLRPEANWRSPTSTSSTSGGAACEYSGSPADLPGWTPAPAAACMKPRPTSKRSKNARA